MKPTIPDSNEANGRRKIDRQASPYSSKWAALLTTFLLAFGSASVFGPALADEDGDETSSPATLTVEQITGLPRVDGTPPARPVWSPQSDRVAFLWNDEGMPFRDLWVVAAGEDTPTRLTHLAPEADEIAMPPESTSLEALSDQLAKRHDSGLSDLFWGSDGDTIRFIRGGRLYEVNTDGGDPRRLLEDRSGISRPALSPDGQFLAFLAEGDLWLADAGGDDVERVTDFSEPTIATVGLGAYVRPDVYISRYEWSPDSARIALEKVDQRDVRKVPFPSYLHDEPLLHEVRRPYPGDTDLVRRVGVLEVGDNKLDWLDLEEANRRLNLEIAWSPASDRLLVMQGADVAEDRWILVADLETAEISQVWHDHRPRRIYPPFSALWSGDGEKIFFTGDSGDWYRLYSVPAEGGQATGLTGDYDVAGDRGAPWIEVDPNDDRLFLVSAEHSPYERHVHVMSGDGGQTQRLTTMAGMHEPALSPDGNMLALLSTNDTTPTELYLLGVGEGSEQRRITRSPTDDFENHDWIPARYVEFDSRIDDYTLHARIVEPPDMDPDKKYPVIIGNIYSDTVRNAWNPDRPTTSLQQQMAMDGDYISVQVDVRGSIGYGVDFREAFQGRWGREDLEDLHSVVEYLSTLPQVDTDRVGLWGNSYGGLLTLSALFRKPGVFSAGVAGAPAVDVWHFGGFDQHLTRRPDTHPDIFEQGSLMDLGEELEDPLMIIHGLHDDIVPFKTTLMLTEKLILLGKDFELVPVHNSAHWWAANEAYAQYTFGRMTDFLRRHVPPGGKPRDPLMTSAAP